MNDKINIVLVAPDIPGNTGSIGRTCVALNARLILIRPYGFDLSEKSVRRAGLDYWKYVDLVEYNSFEEFIESENPNLGNMFLYTKNADSVYYQGEYKKGCYLIFGSETKGLDKTILSKYKERTFVLPMFSDKIRSLNLSNAATTVAYEALRQIDY